MKDAFYELADELGVLIWQEFMFSDADYALAVEERPNSFLENVVAETQHQARRLSSHASVAMWVGNNEITPEGFCKQPTCEWPHNSWSRLFLGAVLGTVIEEDNTRPIWPSGPSDGWLSGVDVATGLPDGSPLRLRHRPLHEQETGRTIHEAHTYYDCVTTTCDVLDATIFPSPSFASEFGWLGLDDTRAYTSEVDWSLLSPLMVHRQNKNARRKNSMLQQRLLHTFPRDAGAINATDPSQREAQFRRVVYLSQLLQAIGLEAEATHYRRSRELRLGDQPAAGTMGYMMWMLNSPYPTITWGAIDVTGKWKVAQHAVARASASVLLSAAIYRRKHGLLVVHLANDRASALTGAVTVDVWHTSGTRKTVATLPTLVHPHAGATLLQVPIAQALASAGCSPAERCYVHARLVASGVDETATTAATCWLAPLSAVSAALPPAHIRANVSAARGSMVVSLRSSVVAAFVTVSSTVQGRFDRNGVTLLPHNLAQLRFLPQHADGPLEKMSSDEFQRTLRVDALNLAPARHH